ncbi:hypothetical protein [Crenothrix polyspora]|uniref:Transcriptional regulator protein n=1 Tax=Crenothrix polyspora TaxID=360316 RepID=A0A1R4H625_9GAMM|nr:hypothetical protein [Crenothrix polyspora]SJM91491.1 Transcriptional regulator protein [Crenothrix polyspora]
MKKFVIVCSGVLLAACTTLPPKNTNNICSVFREKDGWYADAQRTFKRWGVPVPVQMAIMHQESHFVADARPPRTWLGFRASSAYGYSQALDGTWHQYLKSTDNSGADRDDFADASDFIGWYCDISANKLGVSKWDTKNLYLAYHEGHGGFQRKSYLNKPWLMQVAKKVSKRASLFQGQLTGCEMN